MVKGNWQRRIELVEARKMVSKQMKQNKDNRATFKMMAAHLIKVMGNHPVSQTGTATTMHVWADVAILTGESHSETHTTTQNQSDPQSEPQSHIHDKGKQRRVSHAGPDEVLVRTKKAHPRSKQPTHVEEELKQQQHPGLVDDAVECLLCKAQFFQGQCDGALKINNAANKKAKRCRYVHYDSEGSRTLAQVIKNQDDAVLNLAVTSLDSFLHQNGRENHPGGMQMLHYFPIVFGERRHGVDQVEPPSLRDVFTEALSLHSCHLAGIVYVAYGHQLIFDRYQAGLLVPGFGDFMANAKPRESLLATTMLEQSEKARVESDETHVNNAMESLPGAILEYILTFLPDTAVACVTKVCINWFNEIGKSSTHLWKTLLVRRGWPVNDNNYNDDDDAHGDFEGAFKSHYEVVKDVRAIQTALVDILLEPRRAATTKRPPIDQVAMVYHRFDKKKSAPIEFDSCRDMALWSPTHVLAAYCLDCSIRLFQVMEKSGPVTAGRQNLREIMCVSFNPRRRKTIKERIHLMAMALLETHIVALLVSNSNEKNSFLLSIASRDDYLSAVHVDTSGWSELEEGTLTYINVGEMIVNFILNHHDNHNLAIFLEAGGTVSEVQVFFAHSMVDCGQQNILMEASVFIPNHPESQYATIPLGSYFVVISVFNGVIVSMSRSFEASDFPRRYVRLVGLRPPTSGRRVGCSVVAISDGEPDIILSEIGPTGCIREVHCHVEAEPVDDWIFRESAERSWQPTTNPRLVSLFQDTIVAVDVIKADNGEAHQTLDAYRSAVSFYSRILRRDGLDVSNRVKLFESCIILHLQRVRDEHILLVCEELDFEAHVNEDDVSPDGSQQRLSRINAVILHVPTRQIISRIPLPVDRLQIESMYFFSSGQTLCAVVGSKGIIMTGRDVRDAANVPQTHHEGDAEFKLDSGKRKKKKTRLVSTTNGKKDGFARGMR